MGVVQGRLFQETKTLFPGSGRGGGKVWAEEGVLGEAAAMQDAEAGKPVIQGPEGIRGREPQPPAGTSGFCSGHPPLSWSSPPLPASLDHEPKQELPALFPHTARGSLLI